MLSPSARASFKAARRLAAGQAAVDLAVAPGSTWTNITVTSPLTDLYDMRERGIAQRWASDPW
jgi:hypothetical protein